jgi:hypothetical protein
MISTVEKFYVDGIFKSYKMITSDNKIWFVPLNEANTDYQAIQEWAAIDGNNIIDNGA